MTANLEVTPSQSLLVLLLTSELQLQRKLTVTI